MGQKGTLLTILPFFAESAGSKVIEITWLACFFDVSDVGDAGSTPEGPGLPQ